MKNNKIANLKFATFELILKNFPMKKILIPIMIVAIIIAFYEQNKVEKNIYIIIIAIVIFMFGMMKLSAKITSKNQEKEEQDV